MMRFANAQSGKTTQAPLPAIKPVTNTSFGSLKQIHAVVLNVGYAEAGPTNGRAVILLHGWPYDIHTYVDVAPLLASAGYRVIVHYLRGYGTTRFLFFFQAEDGIRDGTVTGVQTCALPIFELSEEDPVVVIHFGMQRGGVDLTPHHRNQSLVMLEGMEKLFLTDL